MKLNISITDYRSSEGDIRPIIEAEICPDNTVSIFSDKRGANASDQCVRYEKLARKFKELVKAFYREVNIQIERGDKPGN